MSIRAELLASITDCPRTVLLRALLRDPSTTLAGDAQHGVVFSAADELAYLWGKPDAEQLGRARRWANTLFAEKLQSDVAPDLQWERVDLFVGESRLEAPEQGVRAAQPADAPWPLRRKLLQAEDQGPVFVSLEDKTPAAFAWVRCRSELHFEPWVHTLDRYRGKGHGRRAVSALIANQQQAGLRPVWSARESSPLAKLLAEKLGFRASDVIYRGERRS